ncbi:MAG TPA: glycosyltransferase family 2 protein, partial [Myxococcales bacterium]|nr:glycosyltransferase family 2 protein [Myxococcales bacterium]
RGRLSSPFFKPDWNPDLLLSQNYVGHLCAVRRSLLLEIGGFREGFEGSQDYDVVLRTSARTTRIRHLPFVAYHWRSVAGSTARDVRAKSYVTSAATRALQEHIGASARVEPGPLPTTYRVRWPVPADPPLVSLIVPTRDARNVLEPCIESLLAKTSYRRFELVVVDNQSTDPATLEYLRELQRRQAARVVRFDAPFNFSAINNFAVRDAAHGELIGLLNNDLEVIEPGWLEEMVSQALRPDIGAVGARLLYPDGTIQHGGVLLGISGAAGHEHKFLPRAAPGYFGRAQLVHDVSAVTAACLLIRRDTYLKAGGLDESFPIAFNDVDFCLRVRALGLRNLWTPFATLVHHESKSRGLEDTPEKKARFADEKRRLSERWGDALLDDPAYNPNLSLDAEDFSLAWPPRVRKPWF